MATMVDCEARVEQRDLDQLLDQNEMEFKDLKPDCESEFNVVNGRLNTVNGRFHSMKEMISALEASVDDLSIQIAQLPQLIVQELQKQLRARDFQQDRNSRYQEHPTEFVSDNSHYSRIDCPSYSRIDFSPLNQLKELQQTGSLEDYLQKFEKVSLQAKCSETEALDLFLGGLEEKLKGLLSLHKPRTVMEAIDYATLYEIAISPNTVYPHCPRFVDGNCNIAESLENDNGLEELVAKEDNEMILEVDEAKGQSNEKELDDVSQAIDGSMELVQELGADSDFEAVKDQDNSSMEEENVINSQVMKMNVGFEEVNEHKTKELFDLDGALDILNHDLNSRAGVICFDGVKADECYYQILEAMVEQVWSGRVLVLMYLDRWNLSLIFLNLHSKKDIIASVPWDFKKRKKSLRQPVSLLGIRKTKKRRARAPAIRSSLHYSQVHKRKPSCNSDFKW